MANSDRRPTTLATIARWPFGVGLTSWRYLWRTTPMHRRELEGSLGEDAPPPLPEGLSREGLQPPDAGIGPLFHRTYRARIRESEVEAKELLRLVTEEPNRASPSEFASFHKLEGEEGRMNAGDEYVVRMAGPWDGPVRVAVSAEDRFRLATLDGHLEAGQIEFRARDEDGEVIFEIESWARSKDRLTDLLYDRLRMSKEVQLHMWVSTLEHVADLSGGRLRGGLSILTRIVPPEALGD